MSKHIFRIEWTGEDITANSLSQGNEKKKSFFSVRLFKQLKNKERMIISYGKSSVEEANNNKKIFDNEEFK